MLIGTTLDGKAPRPQPQAMAGAAGHQIQRTFSSFWRIASPLAVAQAGAPGSQDSLKAAAGSPDLARSGCLPATGDGSGLALGNRIC